MSEFQCFHILKFKRRDHTCITECLDKGGGSSECGAVELVDVKYTLHRPKVTLSLTCTEMFQARINSLTNETENN